MKRYLEIGLLVQNLIFKVALHPKLQVPLLRKLWRRLATARRQVYTGTASVWERYKSEIFSLFKENFLEDGTFRGNN